MTEISDWKIEIGLYLAHSHYNSACLSNGLNNRPISIFQSNFCHSCFRAFYTTIGQSYIPTTFSLENVVNILRNGKVMLYCSSTVTAIRH